MESYQGNHFILVTSDALGLLADRTITAAQNSFKTAGFLQDESSDSNLEARTLGIEQRLTNLNGNIEQLKNDLKGMQNSVEKSLETSFAKILQILQPTESVVVQTTINPQTINSPCVDNSSEEAINSRRTEDNSQIISEEAINSRRTEDNSQIISEEAIKSRRTVDNSHDFSIAPADICNDADNSSKEAINSRRTGDNSQFILNDDDDDDDDDNNKDDDRNSLSGEDVFNSPSGDSDGDDVVQMKEIRTGIGTILTIDDEIQMKENRTGIGTISSILKRNGYKWNNVRHE